MTVNCRRRCCGWKRRSVGLRVACVRRKIGGVVYAPTLFFSPFLFHRVVKKQNGRSYKDTLLWALDTLARVVCSEGKETFREIQNKEFFSLTKYIYVRLALERAEKTD